jgi:hypothetical protein
MDAHRAGGSGTMRGIDLTIGSADQIGRLAEQCGASSALCQEVTNSGSVPRLVQLLGSPAGSVQEQAAHCLAALAVHDSGSAAAIGAAGGVTVLAALATSAPETAVRVAAAWALAAVALKSAPSRPTEAAVAAALGGRLDPAIEAIVVDVLCDGCTSEDTLARRERQIGGSGGSLEPPGPLS